MTLGWMDWWQGATTKYHHIDDISPDLTGKTAVITGANSGIGYQTTLALAKKNAKVFMLCRNKEKTTPALLEIQRLSGNTQVEFVECDLSDWKSVSTASTYIHKRTRAIDILINNAGILGLFRFTECKQGVEMHFSSNLFGHYILTRQLLPLLIATKHARIVNVTSNVHEQATVSSNGGGGSSYFSTKKHAFNFNILEKEHYFAYSSYCQVLTIVN